MKKSRAIFGFMGVAILVFLDQLTKILAKSNLENQDPIIIIKKVFQLQYLENTGAAFGMLKDRLLFFILLTVIVLIFIVYVYYKTPDEKKYTPMRIILVCISAGAIGNMIDRIVNNYVIDFLYFNLIDFPIFNVADCYVTISAFSLVLLFLFYYKESDFDFLSLKKKAKDIETNEVGDKYEQ